MSADPMAERREMGPNGPVVTSSGEDMGSPSMADADTIADLAAKVGGLAQN
jgi:hypothetical protein